MWEWLCRLVFRVITHHTLRVMNHIDFTKPENELALRLLGRMIILFVVFWGLYVKADWVGETFGIFNCRINVPTPGWMLKPFGLFALLACLMTGVQFIALVWK